MGEEWLNSKNERNSKRRTEITGNLLCPEREGRAEKQVAEINFEDYAKSFRCADSLHSRFLKHEFYLCSGSHHKFPWAISIKHKDRLER